MDSQEWERYRAHLEHLDHHRRPLPPSRFPSWGLALPPELAVAWLLLLFILLG